MKATAEGSTKDAEIVTKAVIKELLTLAKKSGKAFIPTVEEIQNLVEKQLMLQDFTDTSKAYILYRNVARNYVNSAAKCHRTCAN